MTVAIIPFAYTSDTKAKHNFAFDHTSTTLEGGMHGAEDGEFEGEATVQVGTNGRLDEGECHRDLAFPVATLQTRDEVGNETES